MPRRLPSVIFSPVPPISAMSARTSAPSTTLLMASCFPVSPERQHVNMSLPLSEILLAITISIACSIAARFAFCSLAPFPITHSPGRPYVAPSTRHEADAVEQIDEAERVALRAEDRIDSDQADRDAERPHRQALDGGAQRSDRHHRQSQNGEREIFSGAECERGLRHGTRGEHEDQHAGDRRRQNAPADNPMATFALPCCAIG